MKPATYKILGLIFLLCVQGFTSWAQEEDMVVEKKPVKNTFESIWIIDNQTVMVPFKGTLEFDIQHRFGLIYNGFEDFWGLYAPSNIRLGFHYVPVKKLMVGFGFTKKNLTWDFNAKYALLQQMTEGGSPISVSYYGNAAMETRDKAAFPNPEVFKATDRWSFFHQLIIARKISEKFSFQVAGSISHFNAVYPAKNSDDGAIQELENDHYAVAFSARYKITNATSIMINYDHPLTTHVPLNPEAEEINDPKPNLSFGMEFATSAHQFQVFLGNYNSLIPQYNNAYNPNWGFNNKEFSLWDPEWLIGFNITRLWSY